MKVILMASRGTPLERLNCEVASRLRHCFEK